MERTLTVHDAKVQTVQVEIKVLKVGKKQVTMGLFRQLPQRMLVDQKTIHLQGVPWGHVNYWWDGDGSEWGRERKRHMVWQEGEALDRSIVYEQPSQQMMAWFERRRHPLLEQSLLLSLQRCPDVKEFKLPDPVIAHEGVEVTWDQHKRKVHFSRQHSSHIRNYCQYRDVENLREWEQTQQTRAQQDWLSLLEAYACLETSLTEVNDQLDAIDMQERDYRQRWAQQWQALCDLPQLFIAV